MGKIIVIDGLDGSGKYTQSILLAHYLDNELGLKVKHQSFPVYESKTGDIITEYLRGQLQAGNDFKDKVRLGMLYSYDRMYNMYFMRDENNKTLIDYYNEGYVIVFDRYTSSNFLYMTHEMSEIDFLKYVTIMEFIENDIMNLPEPDLTIFFNIPPEKSMELINKRGAFKDLHETEEILNKAYNSLHVYKKIINTPNDFLSNNKTFIIDCLDDLMKLYSVEDIFEIVKNILHEHTDIIK